MPVVVQDQGRYALFGVALKGQPGAGGAAGIKESPRRLRCQLPDLSVQILLIELLALAKDGDYDMSFGVAILAGQAVKERRGQLDGEGMKRDDEPLGQ